LQHYHVCHPFILFMNQVYVTEIQCDVLIHIFLYRDPRHKTGNPWMWWPKLSCGFADSFLHWWWFSSIFWATNGWVSHEWFNTQNLIPLKSNWIILDTNMYFIVEVVLCLICNYKSTSICYKQMTFQTQSFKRLNSLTMYEKFET
jgi:hypothetical protein